MTREEHIEWLAGITQCLTFEANEAAGTLVKAMRDGEFIRVDNPTPMSPKEVRDMILESAQDALDHMAKTNKPD